METRAIARHKFPLGPILANSGALVYTPHMIYVLFMLCSSGALHTHEFNTAVACAEASHGLVENFAIEGMKVSCRTWCKAKGEVSQE